MASSLASEPMFVPQQPLSPRASAGIAAVCFFTTLAAVPTPKPTLPAKRQVASALSPDAWLDHHFLHARFAPLFTSITQPGEANIRGNDERK